MYVAGRLKSNEKRGGGGEGGKRDKEKEGKPRTPQTPERRKPVERTGTVKAGWPADSGTGDESWRQKKTKTKIKKHSLAMQHSHNCPAVAPSSDFRALPGGYGPRPAHTVVMDGFRRPSGPGPGGGGQITLFPPEKHHTARFVEGRPKPAALVTARSPLHRSFPTCRLEAVRLTADASLPRLQRPTKAAAGADPPTTPAAVKLATNPNPLPGGPPLGTNTTPG